MDKKEARRRGKEYARMRAYSGFAIVQEPAFGGGTGYTFMPVFGPPSSVEHLSPLVEEWWLWNAAKQQWEKQRLT